MNGTSDFGVIHVNMRSVSVNVDALSAYLSMLNREFDVICLSDMSHFRPYIKATSKRVARILKQYGLSTCRNLVPNLR